MHLGKSHKCCGDEQKLIRLQDDQQVAQNVHSLTAPDAIAILVSDFIVTSFYNNNNDSCHQQDHSPPLLTGQDIYLQNCVFRI